MLANRHCLNMPKSSKKQSGFFGKNLNRLYTIARTACSCAMLHGCSCQPTPSDLGLQNGLLRPCSSRPNCVSSQAQHTDREHFVAPIRLATPTDDLSQIALKLERISRLTIQRVEPHYLHAEVQSKLLGFIDDLELLLDADNRTLHCRSGSRLGYSDLGVNRKRIEALRSLLQE